jgi:hypothetical protein
MFGNGGMVGTAVALSNSLGLNRDCSAWEISPGEKALRSRIWSIVVLMDRWYVVQGLLRFFRDTDCVTGQVLLMVHHS